MILNKINLRMFDANTNKTTDVGLSDEMKIFYSDYLIDLAEPELVHDQFGQKHPIPKNGGKTIEFRKYDSLPKALTPLTEGVTPDGQKLNMGVITSTVNQYGGYIEVSDVLILTAIDDNIVEATALLASQAGRTLDTVTREVLNGGTNVQYGDGSKTSRSELVGGETSGNDYLTVLGIRKGVTALKRMNTKKINGDFVGIIHPDAAFDLMSDPEWKYPHQYVDTSNLYEGEIGKIAGVRFVETTEAKVFAGESLASDSKTLLVNGAITSPAKSITFDGGTVAADSLVGRKILVNNIVTEVVANTTTTITVKDNVTAADNAVIYPGEGGAEGRDVYSTLILGANAYGVTEITGGGLQHIVKQLGSGGTTDPLNQRATVGWKAMKTAERLVEQYMIRIETCSTFESGAN